MKYVMLIGDGMADYPVEELDGLTPLEASETENMDRIAASGVLGRVRTVPEGMEPGSDVANLSLLGYDPVRYHTGRGALEAASMGVEIPEGGVAFRMNLVTVDRRPDGRVIMLSHNSGEVTAEEAAPLLEALRPALAEDGMELHQGVGYRHLLVWPAGPEKTATVPPHDYLGRDVSAYLNADADPVARLIRRSWAVLEDHPVNKERRRAGRSPANSIWLWGRGRPPGMPSLFSLYGLKGGVISAVDLIKGIGVCAGLTPIHVPGATGLLETDYEGKVRACLEALEEMDLVFLHVEAPDEAGHAGDPREKIQAIEYFDRRVVGPVLEGLEACGRGFRVLVASDHYTPIIRRTHTAEPSPFACAEGRGSVRPREPRVFSEKEAGRTGLLFDPGWGLMEAFLRGEGLS